MSAIHHLAATAGDILAYAPAPSGTPDTTPTTINTDGIISTIATLIVPIILACIGVFVMVLGFSGKASKVMTTSAIAIVGVAFIAGAGLFFAFGDTLIHTAIK